MIELEIGKTYAQKELANALDIKPSNFSRNRDKFLTNLSLYYEYETEYKGRCIYYTIVSKIADYKKPERSNSLIKSKKIAHDKIIKVATRTTLFTYIGIQREMILNGEQNDLSETYLYERIRIEGNEMFGRKIGEEGTEGIITERVWCRLVDGVNLYEPMSDVMIDAYRKIVSRKNKEFNVEQENIYEDYINGLLNHDEYKDLVADSFTRVFIDAKIEFKDKYGFTPVKIPRRELKAWKELE